ncbi:type II secretion system protein GspD [Pseudomonadota bacterium]
MVRKFLPFLLLFFLCFCSPKRDKLDSTDYIDRRAGLTREDFEDGLSRPKSNKKDKDFDLYAEEDSSSFPPMSKLLVSPPPPPMGNGELISFSVTEDVPLKDVLIELGRVADIDIEIDPTIDGGIILKVKDKSLKLVVERICDLGGLRYSYNDGILKFEKDSPYTKNHTVDFLIDGGLWGSVEASINEILTNHGDGTEKVNINKPAGIISIYANDKVQKGVKEYITEVRGNASAQVLIEAKVVEVSLKDEFSAGIDWDWKEDKSNATTTNTVFLGSTNTTGAVFTTKALGAGGSLTANISALRQFGTTRTLSSPRIVSLNNQEATLEFTDSLIYFELDIETEEETNTSGETIDKVKSYSSSKKEDSEGVTLKIKPSIDVRKNEITLKVIPTLKVKTGEVEDPALTLQLNALGITGTDVTNLVPVIQTRTLETSLKIRSGEAMVIGGLMSESVINDEDGIPWLSEIPILGQLFKKTTEVTELVETIIFIKATIIDSGSNGIDKKDREFYDTFSTEKRRMI